MLNNATITKLHEMKLASMAEAYNNQLNDKTYQDISFEDRFGLLVDQEWSNRRSNRLTRLIKNAKYTYNDACIENIEYHPDRKLDRTQITRLSTCNYIEDNHNIIILGATGSGKTYIANAFGIAANRNFYSAKYIRLPELLDELAFSRVNNTYPKVMKTYCQAKLLILDDWLLIPLKEHQAYDLLEIIECRYKKSSTIFCSQFDIAGWHENIGYTPLADAICDRIAHDSYSIFIDGTDSMRKRKGIQSKE